MLVMMVTLLAGTEASVFRRALSIRGGSSTKELRDYRIQQHMYLQSRSLQLRQELIERGLVELHHSETAANLPKKTDWDCVLSTDDSPKECLYTLVPETNTKLLAPLNTTKYISIVALNRLRRQDPTKIEPLWNSQYKIIESWFHPKSKYSLYEYTGVSPTTFFLDHPTVMAGLMALSLLSGLLIFRPVVEWTIAKLLTSRFLWDLWPHWGRYIVHANLPLQLYFGQQILAYGLMGANRVFQSIRRTLVEIECQRLYDCIPLTVVEEEDVEDIMEHHEDETVEAWVDDESFAEDEEEDDEAWDDDDSDEDDY